MKVGQTLYLEAKNDRHRYRCKISAVADDRWLIDIPVNIQTNRSALFFDGTTFKAWYVDDERSLYVFETQLIGRVRDAAVPLLAIDAPEKDKIIRIQRRNFKRVQAVIDCAVHDPEGISPPFTTVTVDISGGGVQLVVPEGKNLKAQRDALCWLVLPMRSGEIFYLKLASRVVRVFDDAKTKVKKASLSFSNISDEDRQHLIRFCFEQEVKLREMRNI